MMQSIQFSVDSAAILKEAFDQFNGKAPGMCEGLDAIRIGLVCIARRAIELGDDALIQELVRLGCLRPTPEGGTK